MYFLDYNTHYLQLFINFLRQWAQKDSKLSNNFSPCPKSKQGTPRRLRRKRRAVAKKEGMTSTGVVNGRHFHPCWHISESITPSIGQKRPLVFKFKCLFANWILRWVVCFLPKNKPISKNIQNWVICMKCTMSDVTAQCQSFLSKDNPSPYAFIGEKYIQYNSIIFISDTIR